MKRIAILVETALDSGRQIARGISRFARERNDWSLFYHTGQLGAMVPASIDQWQGHGIIARIADSELLARVQSRSVPVVDVLGNVPNAPYPLVKCDDRAIARLAGRHFKERGFRNLAFFGLRNEAWSIERRLAFATFCEEMGLGKLHALETDHEERDSHLWPSYLTKIESWIATLPKPVGIMIASDQFGPDLLAACHSAGFTVPDQVSLVGVDNDLPFCELCQPRLSSIEPNHEAVGYEAARMLNDILDGKTPPSSVVEIPPSLLHVRLSSDATALDDPALVKSLRFIRSHACEAIGVDDVAKAAGVSRSVLQRRFRSVLDQTVLESILSVRINRAKEMLATTDLPLPDLAERCGFRHQEYLGFVFKKRIGCTPGQYRAKRSSYR